MGTFYRNPRTKNERKQYFDALDQGCKPRPRRNYCNLPDEYDDLIRKDIKYRNWKAYRKIQRH